MTQETRQASIRGRLNTLEESLAKADKQMTELVEALNTAFGNMNKQVVEAVETLNAVVAHIGADKVAEIVVSERKKKASEEAEQRKTMLQKMVEGGLLAKAEVISDKSVIVGQETDKDGKEVDPGYAQLQLSAVKPEFQAQLRGQKAGFVLDTPNGKVIVKEVWDFVDAPPPPPAPEPVVEVQSTPPVVVEGTPSNS